MRDTSTLDRRAPGSRFESGLLLAAVAQLVEQEHRKVHSRIAFCLFQPY